MRGIRPSSRCKAPQSTFYAADAGNQFPQALKNSSLLMSLKRSLRGVNGLKHAHHLDAFSNRTRNEKERRRRVRIGGLAQRKHGPGTLLIKPSRGKSFLAAPTSPMFRNIHHVPGLRIKGISWCSLRHSIRNELLAPSTTSGQHRTGSEPPYRTGLEWIGSSSASYLAQLRPNQRRTLATLCQRRPIPSLRRTTGCSTNGGRRLRGIAQCHGVRRGHSAWRPRWN